MLRSGGAELAAPALDAVCALGTLTGGPTAAAPVFDAYLRDTPADLRGRPAGD